MAGTSPKYRLTICTTADPAITPSAPPATAAATSSGVEIPNPNYKGAAFLSRSFFTPGLPASHTISAPIFWLKTFMRSS